MKRICWSVAILFTCVFAAQSQSRPVKVHVHVILVDSELNQKPVPFLNVTLKGAAASSDVKTGLDGAAETTLSPGTYTVTTVKPVDFDGKRYSWSVRVTLTGTEKTIDLTNENAKAEDNAAAAQPRFSGASSGDLTEQFKKLKNTVVTVISESGHGTGFFVDGKGLILTNQHVVAQSQYLAVQFDREHKIAARLIASDAQKDVALLWANMSALPSATPTVLARSSGSYTPVQEGERVFTIGSPLSLDKIITTGIVSKVDAHTIMSDININPGNSGGPLFNNAGQVIGLTTFGTSAERGPGVSGVVRIEEARALLEQNRGKATGTPPSATLLPVEPLTPYPVEGLKAALQGEKFDVRPYYLNAGDFEVALSTPPFDYREKEEGRLRAERTQSKRNRRDTNSPDAAQQDANREDSPRDWESETGGHRAVFGIYVVPKVREGFGSALSRSLRNGYGAANLKFKTDFQSMKLFCGEKEVQPIHPGRIPLTVNVRNASVKLEDSTYKGAYFYPPDAVNPQCGTVKIAIYSSKSEEPVIKTLDGNTTTRIWADFDAFRRADAEAHSTQAQK
ncbi:MAG TPA: serine protease [Terriglobales bacterium]|nr:serine protease [Terriglobales bacterium]